MNKEDKMQQKLAVERMMGQEEAEALDAHIIGYSDHWFRSGDNLSDSPFGRCRLISMTVVFQLHHRMNFPCSVALKIGSPV